MLSNKVTKVEKLLDNVLVKMYSRYCKVTGKVKK